VRSGDEVIVFEPVYDSYVPAIETVGGKAVYATLRFPDYRPDWEQLRSLLSPRTRMIIINSPHNPTGSLLEPTIWRAGRADARYRYRRAFRRGLRTHRFRRAQHQSVAAHPELAARSIVVSSFGKTYHITGWKVGYVLGPSRTDERVPQGPSVQRVYGQYAVPVGDRRVHARRLAPPRPGGVLPGQARVLPQPVARLALRVAGLSRYLLSTGALQRDSDLPDREFARWLTREAGVAVIPVSVFNHDGRDDRVVRFCFAKQEATLAAAGEKLRRL
jgi:methionine aminotransferase